MIDIEHTQPWRGRFLRVRDFSSELRYWVLPQRPAGTEDFTVEQLEALVMRDSIIGVGAPKAAA